MSYRMMFTINAVILAIFGVLFMIMPDFVLAQFKSDVQVATLFVARFFGSAMLLSGLFLWVMKDSAPIKMQKNIATVLLGYSLAGFAMTIVGMSRSMIGVIRANGWALLVLYGVFALVYGYMLFLQPKPKPSESKSRSPRKAKDVPSENNGQSA